MIESGLGIKSWTHRGKIDNRVLFLKLPITNELDIMNAILTRILFLLYIVLVSYS